MNPPGDDNRRPGGGGESVEQEFSSDANEESLPLYRGYVWSCLADDDPRKLASMRRAADCWYEEGQPARIAQRLVDDEIAFLTRIRQASYDVAAGGGWLELSKRPTHEQLQERRRKVKVPKPREKWSA